MLHSDEAYMSSHILYGTMLQRFDALNVRPIDFTALFDKMAESVDPSLMGDASELMKTIAKARDVAAKLKAKNDSFTALDDNTNAFNNKVQHIFAKIINELFGLDWYETYDFIHARNRNNIGALERAIADIKAGDLDKAVDEDLRAVDLTWYAYSFDRETYQYNVDHVIGDVAVETWAKGKVNTIADTYDVARQLMKLRSENGDASACIPKLESELAIQREEVKEKMAIEVKLLNELCEMMEACL